MLLTSLFKLFGTILGSRIEVEKKVITSKVLTLSYPSVASQSPSHHSSLFFFSLPLYLSSLSFPYTNQLTDILGDCSTPTNDLRWIKAQLLGPLQKRTSLIFLPSVFFSLFIFFLLSFFLSFFSHRDSNAHANFY